ncbi:hypothetical protein JCM8547_001854 [Rhodosporidiobolus lusitaniae]
MSRTRTAPADLASSSTAPPSSRRRLTTPASLPLTREAHVAQRLLAGVRDDEYSDLKQYLDWPTSSVEEEMDRRKSLFRMVEGIEKKRFKQFTDEVEVAVPDREDVQSRLELVQKKALEVSKIPLLREETDRLLGVMDEIEKNEGHDSQAFLRALHAFVNAEVLLYQACVREEARWDYLEVLEDKVYEGGEGSGGLGRLPRPRFL